MVGYMFYSKRMYSFGQVISEKIKIWTATRRWNTVKPVLKPPVLSKNNCLKTILFNNHCITFHINFTCIKIPRVFRDYVLTLPCVVFEDKFDYKNNLNWIWRCIIMYVLLLLQDNNAGLFVFPVIYRLTRENICILVVDIDAMTKERQPHNNCVPMT